MIVRLKTLDGAERNLELDPGTPLPEFIDMPLISTGSARSAPPDEITAPIPLRRYVKAGRNVFVQEYVETLR